MFTTYNEYDLLELFESEPISVSSDPLAEVFMYSIQDMKGFKLILTIDVYALECNLSLAFNELLVFESKFVNVTQLNRCNSELFIYIHNKPKVKVIFKKQLGIIFINDRYEMQGY
ncbi:hypothetical protein C7B63_10390 [Bacillus halotolerans]|uniref:hypothetical protein n=1 Tax=Bacillus halotolerans TaxID=260554 RepID=UPI000D01CF57|nr:hypothetical protein [Bacillus halotolerans]PRP50813.1 hypothetical protein C7B63_10390 [Bacillus halotolerans]PRP59200.1 hypothetical protein C7B66_08915 [Bacillus halotolerans]PRP63865.1 hypothetical protein C7B72_08910 [Bacillus halotolerans]